MNFLGWNLNLKTGWNSWEENLKVDCAVKIKNCLLSKTRIGWIQQSAFNFKFLFLFFKYVHFLSAIKLL